MKKYRLYLYKRQQKREQNLLKEQSQGFRSNAAGGPNRVAGGKYIFFNVSCLNVGISGGNETKIKKKIINSVNSVDLSVSLMFRIF